MVKVHDITVRVSRDEKERIKNIAHARGFATVSDMVREFCLRDPLTTEKRVANIDKKVEAIEKTIASMYNAVKYKPQYDNYSQNLY